MRHRANIFLLVGGVNEKNILISGPTVEGFGSVSSRPRVPRSVSPGTPDIGTGGLDLALIGGDPCNVDLLLFCLYKNHLFRGRNAGYAWLEEDGRYLRIVIVMFIHITISLLILSWQVSLRWQGLARGGQ